MPNKTCLDADDHGQQVPDLIFRYGVIKEDFPKLLSIILECAQADQVVETLTLADLRAWLAPTSRFDPDKDIILALAGESSEDERIVGFSRLGWYTGRGGDRLYFQSSYLLPDWRERGYWSKMVQLNEQRLRQIAAYDTSKSRRYFQAWATELETAWIAVLTKQGYQAVRHFNNMLHDLENIPENPLPPGLQVRPVEASHFRKIWEAQREVHAELFETVTEQWVEEAYESWEKAPSHTPELWQVAWEGDQVAGMVLTRINPSENHALGRKRGYTEHVFVRQPWRRSGLASALISRSLQVLKAKGMIEAELGVDSENDSRAFGFYQRMGYKTYRIDIWFRKEMKEDGGSAANRDA